MFNRIARFILSVGGVWNSARQGVKVIGFEIFNLIDPS